MTTKAELGRLAAAVRAETGCGPGDPFDPWAWSEENGIPFLSLDDLPVNAAAKRHFTVTRPGVWSAALARTGMQFVVIYNSAHSPERTRSNLAHEVAHFAAEHELSAAWIDEKGSCGSSSKGDEKDASELAGALLIPPDAARSHAFTGGSPSSLAARYRVSERMALWRMEVSGGRKIAQRYRARQPS
ncbi:MAG: ImmA/IrrE family metallo-endopeptidase [Cellulomonadaceae bacterium]|nr:ImmA/IrrE family metallo-endopeptidase [Cellulomonadaceae bacterium]